MKRRLVLSGYPCPPRPWKKYMPDDCEQRFIPFSEVLQAVGKPDFKALARYVSQQMTAFNPTSIVCHDFAVTYTLLAVLYLRKKDSLNARLTIFNGAFRGFDVFRAPHPFRSQWISWGKFVREVSAFGGEIDPEFLKLNPIVRALYRRIIAFNLKEKVKDFLRPRRPLGLDLGIPSQIIASPNDRYIPFDVVELIRDDFKVGRFSTIEYGHFPYSANQEASRKLLIEFESQ